ncbi:hypothetical protein JXM67_09815 [candidate division WOR-3 bacterium]|nr:hypothetical protein [candidate division WOR-3 bacterium]
MKTSRITCLTLVLASLCLGQTALSGLYENVFSVQRLDEVSILDMNGVVLSVDAGLGELSFLHVDAEANLPFGAVQANLLDFVPDSLADLIPDSMRIAYDYRLKPGFKISNAYMALVKNRLSVRIGKQPLAWGTGYVWNPTEIIAPKLAYDPSYRRDGEASLKIVYSWRQAGGIEAIGLLRGTPDSTMFVGRLKENLFGVDIAAIGAHLWDTTIIPGTTQRRTLLGGQLAGEIVNVGFWAEAGYNLYEEDSLSYVEIAAGIDHTFTFRTHVMAEYLYYGRGFESADEYTFKAWIERAGALRKAMGRHLVYLGANQTIISFHSVGLSAIINPQDVSGMIIPSLNISLGDNIDASIFGFISFGSEGSEFGGAAINGGVLRLTGYF